MLMVNLHDIPESGKVIEAANRRDGWLDEILKEVYPGYEKEGSEIRLTIQLYRYDDHVEMVGGFYMNMNTDCSRCLVPFQWQDQVSFHVLLIPTSLTRQSKRKAFKAEEDDDTNISFFDGIAINVEEQVKEQMMLNFPMSVICSSDCKGLCPSCGHNLNEGACQCKPTQGHSPFSILKKLKS